MAKSEGERPMIWLAVLGPYAVTGIAVVIGRRIRRAQLRKVLDGEP